MSLVELVGVYYLQVYWIYIIIVPFGTQFRLFAKAFLAIVAQFSELAIYP
jgi:hypothetical protein